LKNIIEEVMKQDCENCHGCKWLDEVKSHPPGSGYCCHVVRSSGYNPGGILNGKLEPGDKIRRPEKGRCELYEAGDFATRYQTEGGAK